MTDQWIDRLATPDRGIAAALAAVKSSLDLVRARADIASEALPAGAVRGLWHVRDRGTDHQPTFYPIAREDGGYREPDSRVPIELRAMDMRRREVAQRVFTHREREMAEKRKATELRKEQERDVMKEDIRAGWRVKGRIFNGEGKPIKRKRTPA